MGNTRWSPSTGAPSGQVDAAHRRRLRPSLLAARRDREGIALLMHALQLDPPRRGPRDGAGSGIEADGRNCHAFELTALRFALTAGPRG